MHVIYVGHNIEDFLFYFLRFLLFEYFLEDFYSYFEIVSYVILCFSMTNFYIIVINTIGGGEDRSKDDTFKFIPKKGKKRKSKQSKTVK